MKTVRCAIYTRKSSDEGLEQGFNSLDAQREACAAYILSQASEGWIPVADLYDDGGFSGGTLERPALKRLLADIDAGRIDIIVVYKVDRLTRSLLDFSKLVEAFDKAGVSFVSITQSFNTTTSMGRLTLNMLLSFAQFEREVTAERIRDKIAASKAKGMWMGGTTPLGYRPDGRSLAVVDDEAALIRHIYDRYLALGAVRLVAEEFVEGGIKAPVRLRVNGKPMGGGSFSRGQLYFILKNPIYAGDIAHKDLIYPGRHDAIIDRAIWDKVQALLAEHLSGERATARRPRADILANLLVDDQGAALIPSHAVKGKVRYRYYVSRGLHHGEVPEGMRIPAPEIEGAVAALLSDVLADPIALAARCQLNIVASRMANYAGRCVELAGRIRRKDSEVIRALIRQVRVSHDGLAVDIACAGVAAQLGIAIDDNAPDAITLHSDARLRRTGRAMRMIEGSGMSASGKPDPVLSKLVARAHRWWAILKEGEINLQALAKREGVTRSYMTRVVRLAFLSPQMVEAILSSKVPVQLTPKRLTATDAIAADWERQRRSLLAPRAPLRSA